VVKSISENALRNNHNNKRLPRNRFRTGNRGKYNVPFGTDLVKDDPFKNDPREPDMTGSVPRKGSVILVGFMGAGKSSVGRAMAERLEWTFEDLDTRVEQSELRTVAEIFRERGEAYFRRAECAALQELLGEVDGKNKIIALGGGAFVYEATRKLIESAKLSTVFLDAGVDELWIRCTRQAEAEEIQRPILGSRDDFAALYETRRPEYLKASFRHETAGKTVDEIAAGLIQILGLAA
jgi:shikimate kinase